MGTLIEHKKHKRRKYIECTFSCGLLGSHSESDASRTLLIRNGREFQFPERHNYYTEQFPIPKSHFKYLKEYIFVNKIFFYLKT